MTKLLVSNSIIVNAPLEMVYENFNDPVLSGEWMVGQQEVYDYRPPLAVGDTYDVVTFIMGQRVAVTSEVLAIDPPNLFRFRVEGPISGVIQHDTKSVDGRTRVSITFDGEMLGLLGNLATPLLKHQMNKRMKNDLKSFKTFIERR